MAAVDTIEFRVIGEQRDGYGHLLLLGDDGHYYEYVLSHCEVTPVDLDDSWLIDPAISDDLRLVVPASEVAAS